MSIEGEIDAHGEKSGMIYPNQIIGVNISWNDYGIRVCPYIKRVQGFSFRITSQDLKIIIKNFNGKFKYEIPNDKRYHYCYLTPVVNNEI